MIVCKECGRVKSEPLLACVFRVEDIPRRILQEAEERLQHKEDAGHLAGLGGPKEYLLQDELRNVILSKLRLWYEDDEIAGKTKEGS